MLVWRNVLNYFQVTLSLFFAAFLVACEVEEEQNTSLPFSTSSCGPEIQGQLVGAVDVLVDRGFEKSKISGFLLNATQRIEVNCPIEGPWQERLKKRLGPIPSYYIGADQDAETLIYDIHSGARYDMRNPIEVAKAFPDCFKSGNANERCRPVYHPQYSDPVLEAELRKTAERVCWNDPTWGESCQYLTFTPKACVLTAEWKRFCKTTESAIGCWGYGRADLVTAPPSKNVENRIRLAAARRVDGSGPLTQSEVNEVATRTSTTVRGNLCESRL